MTNPFLLGTLSLWHKSYGNLRLVDAAELKEQPKVEMTAYQENIYRCVEDKKDVLKQTWLKVTG